MSAETYFRIICALIAIGMAGFLIAGLVIGRTRVGRRSVERRTAPRIYWGSLGKVALLMTSLAVTPLWPPERDALPVVFLGLVGGQLFEMLVSGIVQMPTTAYERATQPRAYWGWVAFHAAFAALILLFLIAQRAGFTIL